MIEVCVINIGLVQKALARRHSQKTDGTRIHKMDTEWAKGKMVCSVVPTFVFICSGVSVKKIDEVGSLELIFDFGPCRAGKKVE